MVVAKDAKNGIEEGAAFQMRKAHFCHHTFFAGAAGPHPINAMMGTVGLPSDIIIRDHRPGDMGWVIEIHAKVYVEGYGWDKSFEASVARTTADFIDKYDPAREHCWIADRQGEPIGSIFLIRDPQNDGVANFRLLIVDPSSRRLGIGSHLVDECIRFARIAGYQTLSLWTHDPIMAEYMYKAVGFKLLVEKPTTVFGKELVVQKWELELSPTASAYNPHQSL